MLIVLALFNVAACGNDSPNNPTSACGRAWEARCLRACECQTGDQCVFAAGTLQRDGGITIVGGAVIGSLAECLTLERINCSDYLGTDEDAMSCIEDTADAECVDFDYEGTTYRGVVPTPLCPS